MIGADLNPNPARLEAEVLMRREVHSGSFLVVEGRSDSEFWRPRIERPACMLVPGQGKENVVGVLTRLDGRGFEGALGIVDSDFDLLERLRWPSRNLLATDTHDLECELLRSSALDRLLDVYADPDRLAVFERNNGKPVRDALVQRGLPFGRLRWLAHRKGWKRPFDALRASPRFVDEEQWQVDLNNLYDVAVLEGLGEDRSGLDSELATLPPADPWCICQGHDLVELLRIGLRHVLGSSKRAAGSDELARYLRGCFQDRELDRGTLGQRIRAWELLNPPYRILPASPA